MKEDRQNTTKTKTRNNKHIQGQRRGREEKGNPKRQKEEKTINL